MTIPDEILSSVGPVIEAVAHDISKRLLLDTEAADWDEPSRADVEARFHTFDAPTLADALGITDADDYSWDASRLPLSQSPVAQRIREQIAENECRRFRAELDGYGMGDAS